MLQPLTSQFLHRGRARDPPIPKLCTLSSPEGWLSCSGCQNHLEPRRCSVNRINTRGLLNSTDPLFLPPNSHPAPYGDRFHFLRGDGTQLGLPSALFRPGPTAAVVNAVLFNPCFAQSAVVRSFLLVDWTSLLGEGVGKNTNKQKKPSLIVTTQQQLGDRCPQQATSGPDLVL